MTADTITADSPEALEQVREWVFLAARAADERKATDIVIQRVREALVITDYFLIVTAANERQVDAVVELIEERLRLEAGLKPIGREGLDRLEWVLLDYGDFVVHVFQPEVRDFYRLETLWGDVETLSGSAAGVTEPVYSERIGHLLGL